jgi:hypothetical protein
MKWLATAWSVLILVAVSCRPTWAECSLDHLIIGCNRDGIEGTDDDEQLFVDCKHKYRHSGDTEYANWFYPLYESAFPTYPYRISEPGIDAFQSVDPSEDHTYDPNCAPTGLPLIDYDLVIECVAFSPGLQVVHKDYPQFTLAQAGDSFDHSDLHALYGEAHVHLSYQAGDGQGLYWVTFRVRDALDDGNLYRTSRPVTIVFNVAPLRGDLVVDGEVSMDDLARFSEYWVASESSMENDYCERTDVNRDGFVDFVDFAHLAANWRAWLSSE